MQESFITPDRLPIVPQAFVGVAEVLQDLHLYRQVPQGPGDRQASPIDDSGLMMFSPSSVNHRQVIQGPHFRRLIMNLSSQSQAPVHILHSLGEITLVSVAIAQVV